MKIFSNNQTIVTPTYKEQAYRLIKESILYQRLQTGEIYSQEAICSELGISRTPVREALLELQKEGYIRFNRGKGVSVVALTAKEARDIMEIRIYNEQIGARLAALRATDQDLQIMKRNIDEMLNNVSCGDYKILYELDRSFHRAIFFASGNVWALRVVEDLRDHFLRLETKIQMQERNICEQIIHEHTLVYDAIKSHNAEKAVEAIKDHLIQACKRTVKQYYDVESILSYL